MVCAMALGAAAKDPSWTLQAVCRYCESRKVESSPLDGDDASRHPIATAVVHVRMVRIAPDARTCAPAHKLSHQHARFNRYEVSSIPSPDGSHNALSGVIRLRRTAQGGYAVANLSYPLGRSVQIGAQVNNLFDRTYY